VLGALLVILALAAYAWLQKHHEQEQLQQSGPWRPS
jgi:hypothetical protein